MDNCCWSWRWSSWCGNRWCLGMLTCIYQNCYFFCKCCGLELKWLYFVNHVTTSYLCIIISFLCVFLHSFFSNFCQIYWLSSDWSNEEHKVIAQTRYKNIHSNSFKCCWKMCIEVRTTSDPEVLSVSQSNNFVELVRSNCVAKCHKLSFLWPRAVFLSPFYTVNSYFYRHKYVLNFKGI